MQLKCCNNSTKIFLLGHMKSTIGNSCHLLPKTFIGEKYPARRNEIILIPFFSQAHILLQLFTSDSVLDNIIDWWSEIFILGANIKVESLEIFFKKMFS